MTKLRKAMERQGLDMEVPVLVTNVVGNTPYLFFIVVDETILFPVHPCTTFFKSSLLSGVQTFFEYILYVQANY